MTTSKRKDYTVLKPFPHYGGRWTVKGEVVSLLDVEAAQWLRAGRLERVVTATATAAKATTTTKKDS